MAINTQDIQNADIDQSSKDLLTNLLAEIDELKARSAGKQPVKYVIYYDDGTTNTFDLVPAS